MGMKWCIRQGSSWLRLLHMSWKATSGNGTNDKTKHESSCFASVRHGTSCWARHPSTVQSTPQAMGRRDIFGPPAVLGAPSSGFQSLLGSSSGQLGSSRSALWDQKTYIVLLLQCSEVTSGLFPEMISWGWQMPFLDTISPPSPCQAVAGALVLPAGHLLLSFYIIIV